jgi:hypothetical protein
MIVNNRNNFDFGNSILINNTYLDIVQEYKYLGYIIDNKFGFFNQLNNVRKKLAQCSYALTRAKKFIPQTGLIHIYNAIGLSHILYNKFIIFNASSNKCKAIITQLSYCKVNISNSMDYNKIFDLNYIIKFYCFIFIYKIWKQNFSKPLKNQILEKPHNINVRNKNIFKPQIKNNFNKLQFSFISSSLWNSLPSDIQCLTSFDKFKSRISEHLCSINI